MNSLKKQYFIDIFGLLSNLAPNSDRISLHNEILDNVTKYDIWDGDLARKSAQITLCW